MQILVESTIFRPMKDAFKNPHTFDVNDYYSGLIYVIGGRDIEKEEKANNKKKVETTKAQPTIKLDWSFLKKNKRRFFR